MSRVSNGNIVAGIACGMGAGALWGLVFLAPEVMRGFSPLQQAVGRYLAYGLLSALLIAPRWRSLAARMTPRLLWALAWLALAGNLFY
jgi:drug/metabolite transporter (DMT)-like permease